MSAEELTRQLRELTKQLLAYGAKLPEGADAVREGHPLHRRCGGHLRPRRRPARRGRRRSPPTSPSATAGGSPPRSGSTPRLAGGDLDGVRATLGVSADTERISYRELQARREQVRAKFSRDRGRRG